MISLLEQVGFARAGGFRPLGNRVMLERVETAVTRSGFVLHDHWQFGSVIHTVLAVGPGGWVWNKKRTKRHWITPTVQPGETVISFHGTRASEHPDWRQPVYLDHSDGRGRVIVDSRFIELTCKSEITQL